MKLGIVLAAVMFSSSSYAFEGPSFNCRYARTADEVMVCQNAKLSDLIDAWLKHIHPSETLHTILLIDV
jgi:uncharacterized protein